jgi:hypothetical protein
MMVEYSLKFSEYSRQLREIYSPVARDDTERIMVGIDALLFNLRSRTITTRAFLEDAMKLIYRLFDFREIALGLKDRKDGLYRYEVILGYRKDSEVAYRQLVYKAEEMDDPKKYPVGVYISRYGEYSMVEGQPYKQGEEETYNRPLMLKKERAAPDDFIEGDYIQIYFYGMKGDYLGWIELSGPKSGKIPPRSTIKWIEFIAQIMGTIVYEREFMRPSA